MSGKQATKIVHAVNLPEPRSTWPTIMPQVEADLVDLLIPILAPIGQQKHASATKSKRKQRKKKNAVSASSADHTKKHQAEKSASTQAEPAMNPSCVTIGFNSTIRHLETLARTSRASSIQPQDDTLALALPFGILVCTSMLPHVMTDPLPQLAAMASPKDHQIRMVPISQQSAARLAQATHQPRLNVLGLLPGDAETETIQRLICEEIEPIKVPWIYDGLDRRYQPVNIHSEEVVVTKPRAKNGKRKRDGDMVD